MHVCALVVALCVRACVCVCVHALVVALCVCMCECVCMKERERGRQSRAGGKWGASDFMKSILITLCNPQHSVITRLLCSSTEKLTKKETLSLQAET